MPGQVYLTAERKKVFALLIVAGLLFVVLDWIYFIFPPVWPNEQTGQYRTILDIGRSVSLVLFVISGYFAFTYFHEKSFLSKLMYWVMCCFACFLIVVALVLAFVVIIISIYGA